MKRKAGERKHRISKKMCCVQKVINLYHFTTSTVGKIKYFYIAVATVTLSTVSTDQALTILFDEYVK